MDASILVQFVFNGLMLGVIYAMVAVGFTLFFGVLDVIKFSHGDVLTVGAFAGLVGYLGVQSLGLQHPLLALAAVLGLAFGVTALLGAGIARWLVLPMRGAPPINILLMTLMLGTALREAVRLFYPNGSNPQAFPALVPNWEIPFGAASLRGDSVLLFATGILVIAGLHLFITKTRMGMAIRAVAQDGETAQAMGVNFNATVLTTFALGSALAGLAGVINGLYYNEVNFGIGLLLGVVGFAAAILGGLGNVYGAIIGGFTIAAIQTATVVVLPVASGYKDVVAFTGVILLMTWRPTGLISERGSDRV